MNKLLPLSLTALALILIGTSLPGTYENGTQQASVALAQTTVTPIFTTDSITVQEGQTARVTITLPQPVTKTTRVQFTVTPGTARTGTDYIRPSTQTVVFYPNGLTSKTISIRTRTDRTQESNETFSVNLTRVDGKALTEPQRAVVTIADRSASGSVPTPTTDTRLTTGVVTQPSGGATSNPAVTSPRCVAGSSQQLGLTLARMGGLSSKPTYYVGTAYHIPFVVPEQWVSANGGYRVLSKGDETMPDNFFVTNRMDGNLRYEVSISECPGDFNPQTSCYYSTTSNELGGYYDTAMIAPTSNRDTVKGRGGYCEIQGGPGGKQYYYNIRYNECYGAQACRNTFLFYAFMMQTSPNLDAFCRDGSTNPFNPDGTRKTTNSTSGVSYAADSLGYKYCMSLGH